MKLFLIQVVIEKNSKLLEILSFFFFLFGSGIELIAKVSESSLRLSFGKVLFSSGFVLFFLYWKGMKLASVVRMAFAENVHDLFLYRKAPAPASVCLVPKAAFVAVHEILESDHASMCAISVSCNAFDVCERSVVRAIYRMRQEDRITNISCVGVS